MPHTDGSCRNPHCWCRGEYAKIPNTYEARQIEAEIRRQSQQIEDEIRRQLNASEGYDYTPMTIERAREQYDAYRNETPEERIIREQLQAEGLRNAYGSMFSPVYEEKKVESKLPLAIAWGAILVILLSGILWVIL